ncbi:hypothetical protein QTI33_19775 [Variovorax sp. J22P271]|uniref:hypothetical protein n=1 Tax=Variovorax davisae TaxID=3053515 RepID=UPI0025767B35|nr:hypothetical protein [Variovorax sp. J22P271]MDM0034384.1 hypothetical protein [Variovorax sp. J22P271]
MTSPLSPVLRVLQEISHLHVLRDVELVFAPAGRATEVGSPFELRIEACQRALRRLCLGATGAELSRVRMERALFLRLLLASADVRLAAWKSAAEWQPLRRSQLQESLSHDAEQRELGLLEKAMDGSQFANYVYEAAQRASVA